MQKQLKGRLKAYLPPWTKIWKTGKHLTMRKTIVDAEPIDFKLLAAEIAEMDGFINMPVP